MQNSIYMSFRSNITEIMFMEITLPCLSIPLKKFHRLLLWSSFHSLKFWKTRAFYPEYSCLYPKELRKLTAKFELSRKFLQLCFHQKSDRTIIHEITIKLNISKSPDTMNTYFTSEKTLISWSLSNLSFEWCPSPA